MGQFPPEEAPDSQGKPDTAPGREPAPARADDDAWHSARRFGRIRVSGVRANLGRILDISGGGMRVATRSRVAPRRGDTIPVQIDVGDDEWLGVTARVAWVRVTGVLSREIGLEFVEIDDEVRRSLLAIAHTSGSAGGFRLVPESERED